MRSRSLALALLVGLFVLLVPLATPAPAARPARFLLALGDSLAAGYQPTVGDALPPTNPVTGFRDGGYPGSYPGDLANAKHWRLVDLACPGETTASFTSTPAQAACEQLYQSEFHVSSQLDAALQFLQAHGHDVAAVTIDLGANDLDHCLMNASVNPTCLLATQAKVVTKLSGVFSTLHSALAQAHAKARVVSMNYYDPFLALAYRPGRAAGSAEAGASLVATEAFNTELSALYGHLHVGLANVFAAFESTRVLPLTRIGGKSEPAAVGAICHLTYMCRAKSPDLHPNNAGYRAIARAFVRAAPGN